MPGIELSQCGELLRAVEKDCGCLLRHRRTRRTSLLHSPHPRRVN